MSKYVVDMNIIFNAIINQSWKTFQFIMSNTYKLYTSSFVYFEIAENREVFEKKWIKNYEIVLSILLENIEIVDISEYKEEINNFEKIMAKIDIDDTPYVALAHLLWLPLWTNDKKLKQKINFIKVLNTEDILKDSLDEFIFKN